MNKKILVPTDFSKCAQRAMQYAILFAEKNNAKIFFFHATSKIIPTRYTYTRYLEEAEADKQEKLKMLNDEVEQAYKASGIGRNEDKAKCIVKFGTPFVASLLEFLDEHFVDLIIMGTQGASGYRKAIYGTNAASVLNKANYAVIAVPQTVRLKEITKIAYAVSDTGNLKKDLKKIISLLRGHDVSIDIFKVLQTKIELKEYENFESGKFLGNLSHETGFPKLHFTLLDLMNKPLDERIADFVNQKEIDLLVMKTHKRGFWETWYNKSKTMELGFKARFPLMAFK